MNKPWIITEKIIGLLITAFGMIILYSVLKTVIDLASTGFAQSQSLTRSQFFLKYHLNICLSAAAVFGGMLLCYNDKKGWLICIICTVLYFVSFLISSRANSKDSEQPYFEFYKSYSVTALVFLALFIILMQKPFWRKYQPTKKNWLRVIAIIFILLIDKLAFKA